MTWFGDSSIVGFDIDRNALEIAQENRAELELEDVIDFVQTDISSLVHCSDDDDLKTRPIGVSKFDTIIMNPPFGTRLRGIDMVFLRAALAVRPIIGFNKIFSITYHYFLTECENVGVFSA